MIKDDDLKKRFGFNREELAKVLRDELDKLPPEEQERMMEAMSETDFPSVEKMLEFIRKAAKGGTTT